MTEQEWLDCTDPGAMLHQLRDQPATYRTRWQGVVQVPQWRICERKLRLFACGCCRRIAGRLLSEEAPAVIAVAEDHADGRADFSAVERALAVADGAEQARARELEATSPRMVGAARRAFQALSCLARRDLEEVVAVAHLAAFGIQRTSTALREMAMIDEQAYQAGLLHEIAGNPFSPARLDPVWLVWNDGVVERIARGVHDDRAYHDMPILADALLDAGCCDEAILGHCRSAEARHAPGCWVLDLLLDMN